MNCCYLLSLISIDVKQSKDKKKIQDRTFIIKPEKISLHL